MPDKSKVRQPEGVWTFLSNHAHVLICIAADSETRMRDIADRIGVTERAVQRIISELEEGGYVKITREGRRNRYSVDANKPMRHPLTRHRMLSHLIEFGLGGKPKKK